MTYIRTLLDDPQGTGADRQIKLYRETNDKRQVIDFLRERTLHGVTL